MKPRKAPSFRFIRPEPQALWRPRLAGWDAHGEFVPGSDEDGGGLRKPIRRPKQSPRSKTTAANPANSSKPRRNYEFFSSLLEASWFR